jgi:tetratricopeptide (TPR) repeat protein
MNASKSVRYLCQAAFALGSVLAAGIFAQGQDIPGYPDDPRDGDPRELAMLPRYCMYTQPYRARVPGSPEEVKRWTLVMGPNFNDIHHYCWGLMYTNRAVNLARSERMRTHYLGRSIAEFDYVIQRVPPDFKLLPEILTRKGENLIRLDKGTQGISEFERAIALKPDYWPPYAAISDYYMKIGNLAKARVWLEQGLSVTPDVKALKRRMAEIDGAKVNRTTAPQSATPEPASQPKPD